MSDARHQFLDYMSSQGVIPADPSQIQPGVFSRFDLDGESRGKKSGFALYHDDDFPNGIFGNLRIHDKNNPLQWKPKHQAADAWTEDQRKEYAALQRRRQAERKAAIQAMQAEAAEICRRLWSESKPAAYDHAYLERKGVRAHGLRQLGEALIVPVVISGQITSLQFIQPDGSKKFKKAGAILGGYSIIGAKPDGRAVICEGWATGATIHEATGLTVIVAFDAGNLTPVAEAMRLKFPELELLIAADDDRFTNGNPGLMAAGRAAQAVTNCIIRRPIFRDDHERPTDFNDLATQLGNDEVREQILTGKPTFQPEQLPAAVERRSEYSLLEPFPHMSAQRGGKPLATITNIKELLERMGVVVRYNVISKTDEVLIPGESFTVDNMKNASRAHIVSWCNFAKIPTGNLKSFLTSIADENLYNPVATWVQSKPWDRVSRLQAFYDTVTAQEGYSPTLKQTLMKRWLISAVAAAFEPAGISAHGVLVFQGAQNVGKTSWFKRLAPASLKVISDGKTLRLDDKDSIFQVISNWIVELGELDATFKKSDLAHLKAFITKDQDVIRRPFAEEESQFARKTVFFASVNKAEFLADETGNRRYWAISVESIDYQHTIDMQQLWAEVYELYRSGETWYLTPEENDELSGSNEEFQVTDHIEERIFRFYDWTTDADNWRKLTASEILKETGIDRPTQMELNRVSGAVLKLNGYRKLKRIGAGRFMLVPEHPNRDPLTTLPPLPPFWKR